MMIKMHVQHTSKSYVETIAVIAGLTIQRCYMSPNQYCNGCMQWDKAQDCMWAHQLACRVISGHFEAIPSPYCKRYYHSSMCP